jgi:CO dehydrogenase maturation factor
MRTETDSEKSSKEVLAVTGKGGVGKTTFTAILAKILAAEGVNLLAVDADPPVSLTYALGAQPIKTVGDMRSRLIEDPTAKRKFNNKHTRDVVKEEALMELDGMSLLVLGRAEGPGCYCGLNQLLKFGIESLVEQYDITLIDCEAGIEQINRRVIDSISKLIMISDATLKGLLTAAYLSDIASKHGVTGPYETGLVINRADKGVEVLVNKAQEMGLHVLGVIPPDDNVAEYDRMGRPTIELPDDSPSVAAAREIRKGSDRPVDSLLFQDIFAKNQNAFMVTRRCIEATVEFK